MKKMINKMITKTIKKWKKNNNFQCVAGSVFHKSMTTYIRQTTRHDTHLTWFDFFPTADRQFNDTTDSNW